MNGFYWPPTAKFGFSFYIGPLAFSRYWGMYFSTTGPCWEFEYEWKVRNDSQKN